MTQIHVNRLKAACVYVQLGYSSFQCLVTTAANSSHLKASTCGPSDNKSYTLWYILTASACISIVLTSTS